MRTLAFCVACLILGATLEKSRTYVDPKTLIERGYQICISQTGNAGDMSFCDQLRETALRRVGGHQLTTRLWIKLNDD